MTRQVKGEESLRNSFIQNANSTFRKIGNWKLFAKLFRRDLGLAVSCCANFTSANGRGARE